MERHLHRRLRRDLVRLQQGQAGGRVRGRPGGRPEALRRLRSFMDQAPGPRDALAVGLAQVLALKPKLLLMDEAFSALDPLIRTARSASR